MSLRSGRSRRDDPLLEWKIRIFSVAAAVTVVGIYFDERWMTGLALLLLAGGVLLRFVPGGVPPDEDDAEDRSPEPEEPEGR